MARSIQLVPQFRPASSLPAAPRRLPPLPSDSSPGPPPVRPGAVCASPAPRSSLRNAPRGPLSVRLRSTNEQQFWVIVKASALGRHLLQRHDLEAGHVPLPPCPRCLPDSSVHRSQHSNRHSKPRSLSLVGVGFAARSSSTDLSVSSSFSVATLQWASENSDGCA